MADTYKCAACGGVFEKTRTDDEAMAETRSHFGNIRPEECVILCDDCFRAMDPADHPREVEEASAETLRKRLEG